MNLRSQPTPGAEYPADIPIRRQRLLIDSVADVLVQEALTGDGNQAGGFGTRSPSGPAKASLAPILSEAVDHQLQAVISLDVPRDTVHVDIDGRLTRVTRAALLEVTKRIRKLRVSSDIRVHLGSAAFVESAALAGLGTDLQALVGRVGGRPGQGRVSLQTRPGASAVASRHALSGITLRAARLDDFTRADLLTASDFVFAWLDDAHGCPGTDVSAMLALYEHIGREISCRTGTRQL